MTPEGLIKKAICNYLEARRIFFWIQQAGKIPGRINRSRHLRNGVADILGCYRGRMLAIEVKSGKGKASIEQAKFIEEVNSQGGIAIIARSIEDVEKALDGK